MLVRHFEFNEKKRDLVKNWNTGLTTHRALVDRFFKELIPKNLAGEKGSLNYSMIDAYVDKFPKKSHLGLSTESIIIANYSEFEREIDLLATPEIVTIAGDIGSGKTTTLRAIPHFRNDIFVAYLDLEMYSKQNIKELIQTIKIGLVACIEKDIVVFLEKCGKFPGNPLAYHVFSEIFENNNYIKNGVVQNQSAIDDYLLHLLKGRKNDDFIEYCRSHFAFLQKNGVKVVIILDDVDKFKDLELARALIDETTGQIAAPLGVPTIITIRHETAMKFRDAFRPVPVGRMIQAIDPRVVLEKRAREFSNWAKDPVMTNNDPMPDDQMAFVIKRAEEFSGSSFIDRLSDMNPSCDFILDVFRTIVMSPLIHKKKELKWSMIINTLMLHVWNYVNSINSFIINIYDNDSRTVRVGQEYKNTLLRIRLMQTIKMISNSVYDKTIKIEKIIAVLAKCGYDEPEGIRYALSQFARRRLVITPLARNEFNSNVLQIYLHRSLEYYLINLAKNYLYLENIIPTSLIDCSVDMTPYANVPTLEFEYEDFKIMDRNIYNFIRFIEKCEEQEENSCKAICHENHGIENIDALVEVRGNERWSDQMKTSLLKQIGNKPERVLAALLSAERDSIPYPEIRVNIG